MVVLECRGDGEALWRHVMEIGSAITFGESLAAAGVQAREALRARQLEVEDVEPVADLSGCISLLHPCELEPALG